MEIISHRGYWKKITEQNTTTAFNRSFSLGFGVEIDVRDCCGKLVISHDIPNSKAVDFREFLELHTGYKNMPLAINIKADGLQTILYNLLKKYKITNYFVFDMSVPDGLIYLNLKMKVFTRQSEVEPIPPFFNRADGVWMDEFHSDWITTSKIKENLIKNKKVCIVSPELHNRAYLPAWRKYKKLSKNHNTKNIMLCTDFPERARRFFYEYD